jgi:hypothetical protein
LYFTVTNIFFVLFDLNWRIIFLLNVGVARGILCGYLDGAVIAPYQKIWGIEKASITTLQLPHLQLRS